MHKFKDINLDLLKVIACVGVVLLHTEMGDLKRQVHGIFRHIYTT
ncbi:repeating unit O-acetyltransferase WefK [Streptococcus pneumoniae]|nr:repeating unit O-acetyltransferase WefK [Streptococcus pneumoniae]